MLENELTQLWLNALRGRRVAWKIATPWTRGRPDAYVAPSTWVEAKRFIDYQHAVDLSQRKTHGLSALQQFALDEVVSGGAHALMLFHILPLKKTGMRNTYILCEWQKLKAMDCRVTPELAFWDDDRVLREYTIRKLADLFCENKYGW